MSKIVVIGIVGQSVFMSVENFHVGGETIEAKSVHSEFGGKGFNQAVSSARQGANTIFIGAIGEDYYNDVKNILIKEKIEPKLFVKKDNSAFASIITDSSGANRVTVYQGAQLSIDDVLECENEIKNASILVLGNEVDESINVEAVKVAMKYNVKILYNPAPSRPLPELIKNNVLLFTPNEHETVGLENMNNVVITLGKKGCYVKQLDCYVNAYDVGDVVDTTGAGDTFNGSLAVKLMQGEKLIDAVKYANLSSSLSVTKKYAYSSIPTKDEIELLYKEIKNAKRT